MVLLDWMKMRLICHQSKESHQAHIEGAEREGKKLLILWSRCSLLTSRPRKFHQRCDLIIIIITSWVDKIIMSSCGTTASVQNVC